MFLTTILESITPGTFILIFLLFLVVMVVSILIYKARAELKKTKKAAKEMEMNVNRHMIPLGDLKVFATKDDVGAEPNKPFTKFPDIKSVTKQPKKVAKKVVKPLGNKTTKAPKSNNKLTSHTKSTPIAKAKVVPATTKSTYKRKYVIVSIHNIAKYTKTPVDKLSATLVTKTLKHFQTVNASKGIAPKIVLYSGSINKLSQKMKTSFMTVKKYLDFNDESLSKGSLKKINNYLDTNSKNNRLS